MAATGNGRYFNSSTTYEWEIENYSSYNEMAMGKSLRSPSFNVQNLSWHMLLFPNGDREESQGFLSLYISLGNDVPAGTEIHAQYKLSLISGRNQVIAVINQKYGNMFNDSTRSWGKTKFVDKSSLKDNRSITSSNNIKMVCEIVIKEISVYKTNKTIESELMQHFRGLKDLINNPKFSDIKLTVQGKEIFAHKMMLAFNSPVFAAMLEHKMRENAENLVKIEDISYNVFNELLHFIYTGECTLSEGILSELFEAADKYQILKLKDICEEELCKNIKDNNVIAFLQLADMHSAECLKKEAIDFIALYGKDILDKPEFDSVDNLNPKLFKDILRGVFAHVK